jgi:hypothetical protein
MSILWTALLAFLVQQIPAPALQGVVVKLGSGEPIAKATVELRQAGSTDPRPLTVLTGTDGKFAFRDVPQGSYQLAVSRTGYVSTLYGQRRPPGAGETITVESAERKPDFRIVLTPASSISGRISDGRGQPVANAEVSVSKATYAQGRRNFRPVQSALTNDLGEYRVFYLTPGQYFVSAAPLIGERGMRFDNLGTDRLFDVRSQLDAVAGPRARPPVAAAPMYFPGTADADAATPIDLRPGMDFRGVDLIAASARTYSVRGVAVDASTGREVTAPVQLTLASTTGGGSILFVSQTASFRFTAGRLPGTYLLAVQAGELIGRMTIEIRDRDLENVTVPLSRGYRIPGKVAVEGPPGEKPLNLASLRIGMPLDPPIAAGPPAAAVAADGSFTLTNVAPSNYRVTVTPAPPNAYIKSIRLGPTEILTNGLQIERHPDQPLEVLLSTNVAAVEGRVFDDREQPLTDVTVVLVPDLAFRKRADLYKTAVTDASGKFQLKDIAPGDFKLFAWNEVETGAWTDAAFIRGYENQGRSIRIPEGTQHTVNLKVIP